MGLNAQTSVPAFVTGQVLTAAQQTQINTGVPVFATTATRDAAFGGTGEKTLAEGQVCYIETAPDQFQIYDGTAWIPFMAKYTSWSPTYTNLTLGNGSASADYVQIGKFVHFFGQIIFGSTTSVTGVIGVSFPVNASGSMPGGVLGGARLNDSGTIYDGVVVLNSTTKMEFMALNAAGTYATHAAVSTTVPFTWGNGDLLFYNGSYSAA